MLPLQFEQRSMSTQTEDIDITQFLFKEQSPSPRVLLFQTMPEGLPEGCLKQQNQRAMVIVPIITQTRRFPIG